MMKKLTKSKILESVTRSIWGALEGEVGGLYAPYLSRLREILSFAPANFDFSGLSSAKFLFDFDSFIRRASPEDVQHAFELFFAELQNISSAVADRAEAKERASDLYLGYVKSHQHKKHIISNMFLSFIVLGSCAGLALGFLELFGFITSGIWLQLIGCIDLGIAVLFFVLEQLSDRANQKMSAKAEAAIRGEVIVTKNKVRGNGNTVGVTGSFLPRTTDAPSEEDPEAQAALRTTQLEDVTVTKNKIKGKNNSVIYRR